MKHRKLRIAWSVVWGVIALALCVLWMRSYRNSSSWPTPAFELGNFAIYSTPGLMIAARAPFWTNEPDPNVFRGYYIPSRYQTIGNSMWIGARRAGAVGFTGEYWSQSNWVIQTPYWFVVACTAVMAIAPWLYWRFSLRTLLIVTTLVAVLLGLVAWAKG